ncbi:aTP/GTP-binding site motif A (P-loop) [Clostridium sp. CAG:768]|nr:aTP/GTP-binding site motif A (P-loop) [Clostridium sp. CAG:768]
MIKDNINYFWVNQGVNFKEEFDSGVLRSPKEDGKGRDIYKLMKQLKTGDIIINYKTPNIVGYSIVKKPCYIDENEKFIVEVEYHILNKHISRKDWQKRLGSIENVNEILTNVDLTPFNKDFNIKQNGYLFRINKKIFDLIFPKNIPLNQILYGPPGTGKTYNTVIKAMSIIDKKEYKDVSDAKYFELKARFDELKQQGQIEFVTFHQSYSYEEFVEGIKPNLENENDLKYKLEDGIFKKICQNATKTITDNFDEVYEKFINDLADYNEDNLFKLKTGKGKIFGITVNSNKNLSIYMGKNLTKWGTLTKDNLKNLSDWKYYANPIYEYLKNNYSLVIQETQNSTQPYVLIIDEINRGNISKIFGELITLIEEDKRETLSIKLTYSPNDYNFTVPKNLYIIGTMNTSDRSIASIDIALRRRFKFVEMMPKTEVLVDENKQPQMVGDINLQSLLKTINERISYLLDRDHQIGHSYFMNWNNYNMETLADVWFDEIMPLLNEYFYSDWDKLQAILGAAKEIDSKKSFITKIKKPNFPYNADCIDDEVYYNFVKKEDIDKDTDFRTMLENAKLIEPKSNETNEQTETN